MLKVNPEDTIALQYRGNTLRYLDRPEEAVYVVTGTERSENGEGTREKPKVLNNTQKRLQEMLRNAKGFALDALGRYKNALKAFESAKRFSVNGNVKIACCGKCLFLHTWEIGKKTFKAFDRILVFDPENTQASVMRAFTLIQLQKFEKAASILEELTEEDIDSDLSACLLGFACSRLENFERALWAYKKAIEIKPKKFHARNGLAELYFRIGNS